MSDSEERNDESELSALLYPEFMKGMCNAPWDDDACGDCGGHGLKPVYCCNGAMCGCYGMPTEFINCGCGAKQPTDEQIREWI